MENDSSAAAVGKLESRVTELEMLLTHMQKTIHDLDAVLLDQQKQVNKLSWQMSRLTAELTALRGGEGEAREPEEEKPPHY